MLAVLPVECVPSTHVSNLLDVAISHFSYAPLHNIYLECNPAFRTSYCQLLPLQTDFRAFFEISDLC